MTKPFNAAFPHSQRYQPPTDVAAEADVTVDGERCPATVLGRNGPRVQVRFSKDGCTFVRWFDSSDVITAA